MNDLEIKLDRLADGELSREEYAELLYSIEQEEEGWKKCALAFLESQALRTDLRRLVQEPSAAPADVQPATASIGPSRSFAWYWAQALALAACLVVAFWLGRGSLPTSNGKMAVVEPQHPGMSDPVRPHQGRMTLVLAGSDGQEREIDLPVVDGSYVDLHEFLSRSSVIPPDVLAAIERSGHKIERRREFVRQAVDADHEVVVPVDRLRVVPVSFPMY